MNKRMAVLLMSGVCISLPAAQAKFLSNPFHKRSEKQQLAAKPGSQQPEKAADPASMYMRSLWGPGSPLLGPRNPVAMRKYRQYMRKAHHRHFWQRGV